MSSYNYFILPPVKASIHPIESKINVCNHAAVGFLLEKGVCATLILCLYSFFQSFTTEEFEQSLMGRLLQICPYVSG